MTCEGREGEHEDEPRARCPDVQNVRGAWHLRLRVRFNAFCAVSVGFCFYFFRNISTYFVLSHFLFSFACSGHSARPTAPTHPPQRSEQRVVCKLRHSATGRGPRPRRSSRPAAGCRETRMSPAGGRVVYILYIFFIIITQFYYESLALGDEVCSTRARRWGSRAQLFYRPRLVTSSDERVRVLPYPAFAHDAAALPTFLHATLSWFPPRRDSQPASGRSTHATVGAMNT